MRVCLVALLFAGCVAGRVEGSALLAPGGGMEEIEETTVGTLGGIDVGVANIWERDYVDATGRSLHGLTARLDQDIDGETRRVIVGEGSVVELGGARWEVVRVSKESGRNGSVVLRPLSN